MCFFSLGAPFAGALEVIVYAGAIMVLFIFVIMMLNLGESGQARERQWLQPRAYDPGDGVREPPANLPPGTLDEFAVRLRARAAVAPEEKVTFQPGPIARTESNASAGAEGSHAEHESGSGVFHIDTAVNFLVVGNKHIRRRI